MFEPRVALASLSGEADADWALNAEPYAGAAFLGGIALDEATRAAAREMVDRDRNEFLPDDPVAFVDDQLAALEGASLWPVFNVRTRDLGPLREAAAVCAARGAGIEINAHCRQAEMCAAGAGESLLRDAEGLCDQVRAAAETGATVSAKVRAEVDGVDLAETARLLSDAGVDILHVDAMDSEHVVADVVEATDAFVVANNEVRDRDSAWEYLEYGADAVSVGRPSDTPPVMRRVREATDAWFAREQEV